MHEVTELLQRASAGDAGAADRLFSEVYRQLRTIAAHQLGLVGQGPLHATSLVHEVWFRIGRPEAMSLESRQHFFSVAARAMRQLAIDHVRERAAGKRGGGVPDLPLELFEHEQATAARDSELLALDQALGRLRAADPALAELVELRFYAGLEIEEVAELSRRSESSVKRDWRRARAFLHSMLSDGTPG